MLPWDGPWYQLYDVLGIRGLMDFINSPEVQTPLLPVKIVFILFAIFFFCAVIWFYLNSSYLKTQVTQNVSEFVSWEAYGLKEMNRRWKVIMDKIKSGTEREYKLAIVEADNYLFEELQDADIGTGSFEDLTAAAAKKRMIVNKLDVLNAHIIRNSIVHDVNYVLDLNAAKKIMSDYEKAIRAIYSY